MPAAALIVSTGARFIQHCQKPALKKVVANYVSQTMQHMAFVCVVALKLAEVILEEFTILKALNLQMFFRKFQEDIVQDFKNITKLKIDLNKKCDLAFFNF